jgi:hypothetical protein
MAWHVTLFDIRRWQSAQANKRYWARQHNTLIEQLSRIEARNDEDNSVVASGAIREIERLQREMEYYAEALRLRR